MLVPHIALGAVSSPLDVGAERAARIAAEVAAVLRQAHCRILEIGVIGTPDQAVAAGRQAREAGVDAVVLAAASWYKDYLILDLLEEWPAPLLLWPFPGMETGALCGCQQAAAYLRQLAHPSACVFGDSDDVPCRARALAFVRAAALRARLRRCRIGMAGFHVNGMTHTSPHEMPLKRILGPRVVWLDLPALLAAADSAHEAEARRLWTAIKLKAGRCEVDDQAGIVAMRNYLALRQTVEAHGLSALSIGCYPQLMGKVCLAASLLADQGIPMACEGDVHGAVGQFMLQLLTGAPTHNTDWLDPVDANSVVFTHCGSGSLSLAERPAEVRLCSVRLMGQGVCALFTAKPGPMTLLALSATRDGYQCALLEGEAVSTGMVFPGNPVRVRFDKPVSDLLDWIQATGIGQHWMIGGGRVAAEIRAWASLSGPDLRLLEP